MVVPAIPIRVVGGCLWLFKNNTGKYHSGCFQTTNNHLWKKQHTTTKNVNVAAALIGRWEMGDLRYYDREYYYIFSTKYSINSAAALNQFSRKRFKKI